MNEAASFSSITKIGDILGILGSNVKTDLDQKRIQQLFTDYRDTRKSIQTLEIKGSGQTINGIWYYAVSQDEFNRITAAITSHMEDGY